MNDIVFAGKHLRVHHVSRHQHANWELIYCTGDSGTMVFDELRLSYKAGDVVVIPPETPHENASPGGFANIHLNIADANLSFSQPVLIRDDSNETILHLFADAYYLFCGEPARRTALLTAFGNLIVRCVAAYHQAHPKNRAVEQIEQSIVQNYANAHYGLEEVLRTLPYSYDYLCKVFRREMGITPHKYLTNLRLQAAAEMLCAGSNNGNIAEVALCCGFKNPLYFSRLFKNKYGVPPKEYYQQKLDEGSSPTAHSDNQRIIQQVRDV